MPTRTLATDATAQRKASPDLATIKATAKGGGESAAVARAVAHDRAATVREAVTAVAPDQIRTVDLQVEETAELFDSEIDAPYLARERLHIKCVPETAEPVIIEVTDAGGTVQAVEFALHERVRRQLQDEALAAAMERAREKAAQMAGTEGLTIADVQRITTTDVDTEMAGVLEMALSDPDCNIAPTPIALSEAVEVVYTLTEK